MSTEPEATETDAVVRRATRAVETDRLVEELRENGAFGRVEGTEQRDVDGPAWGRTVLTGTEANRRARDRFVDRLEAAGLDVRVDAVGNVVGRWTPESADPDAPAVAAGSHLDSVPEGGIYDGPLGVYAALEAVRAMQAAGVDPVRPVEVVSFTEEEGTRFTGGLGGSSVSTGKRSAGELLGIEDDEGVSLDEAIASIGYRGEGRLDATDWNAFLELHVEQDTRLETAGVPVGVVTTITGIAHAEATIHGEANHAGATPMGDRTDALTAAAELVLAVEDAARGEVVVGDENAVGTVGSVSVGPNATNVVPGRAELGVDVRSVERESMDAVFDHVGTVLDRLKADRGVETDLERGIDLDPTPMADQIRSAAHTAAAAADVETTDLPSGAAHDTMHVADVTDAGLLFAPSTNGVSHNPAEYTAPEDCTTATRVLAGAMTRLARE